MNRIYAARLQALHESATIKVSSLARELKEKGKNIISFSAGEPDFETPLPVKQEAIRAINSGFTHYTAVAGINEVLDAIAHKLKKDNNLIYERDEIVVSNGAKHSIFNIMQALINEGDEVIIPAPYWVSYPEIVNFCGGKPIFVNTNIENSFKITTLQLKQALTSRTKMIVLNSPSNPTGMIYSKDELIQIAEILKGTDIWVLSDEIYEKLIYEGQFYSSASISTDMQERTIIVNGLSKSVAMTGWRMGYLASKDKKLVRHIANLQSQSTTNINSITQKASIKALNGECDEQIESMRREFKKRMEHAYEAFKNIPNVRLLKAQGAFYLFVDITQTPKYKQFSGDVTFCEALIEEAGVALVPGSAFGMSGFMRFSFATTLENIIEGINRISDFLKTRKNI